MNNLVLALAAFVGSHFILSHPLRAPLASRLGAGGFQGLYSLVALGMFYFVYKAFATAPRGAYLWTVGDGLWILATILMLVGSVLLAGSFVGNPALATPGAVKAASAPARGVLAITRHPMMWGFAIWALVHALVAPYAASFILTGGMAILALGGSLGQDRKKAVLMGDGWQDWVSRTAFVPFSGQLSGRIPWASAWPGRTALLGGVLIWLLATYLHPILGGPVAGIWRWMGALRPF
jgi:uncharacterized membrane protein